MSQLVGVRPTPAFFQPADPRSVLENKAHGMSVIDHLAGAIRQGIRCKVVSLLRGERQAARTRVVARKRASTMEREAAETFCLCNYRALTHNKQPINTSPSFLRSQSCSCLEEAVAIVMYSL